MTTLAIDIHDTGLLALDSQGPLQALGPGYALFEKKRPVFGFDALERARLTPGRVYNRFWQEMNTSPLGRPFPRGLSRADLANGHLASAWEQLGRSASSVLLAVPGDYNKEQLALLLGIAQANDIPVTALVDAAPAALCHAFHPNGAGLPACKTVLYLDIHLHRSLATEFLLVQDEVSGPRIERWNITRDHHAGQVPLFRLWARAIARVFIEKTRFDPLHAAQTEQVLYQLLPDWLSLLLQEPEIEASLSHRGRGYKVILQRDHLKTAAAEIYNRLEVLAGEYATAKPGTKLVLSHRLAALPGLIEQLGNPVYLAEDAVPEGLLQSQTPAANPTGQILFQTGLPVKLASASRVKPVLSAPKQTAPAPTHFLHHGLAYPLDQWSTMAGDQCPLVSRNGTLLLEETTPCLLNGQTHAGQTVLASGDRLQLGTREIQLIRVVN